MPRSSASLRSQIPAEIWAIVIAALFIALGFGIIAPVLPAFADSFALDVMSSTIVISSFAVMRLLWAPVAGWTLNRIGERWNYVIGTMLVGLSSLLTGTAGSYWELLAFRSFGGIGSVMFTVSAMAMIVKYSPMGIRGRVNALYGGAFLIGNVLGPLLGGLLGGFGFRVPFFIYAGMLWIAASIAAVMLRKAQVRAGARPREVLPPLTLADALSDRVYRAALTSGFANGWTNFGLRNSVVPLFVGFVVASEAWATSDAAITQATGLVVAAFALGNALALPMSSRIADSTGRKPVVIWGMATYGVLTGMMGLMGTLLALVLTSFAAGFGAGLVNPGQQAALADVIGSQRSSGQALAVFQMVQDLGAIVGPILAGFVVDALGWQSAFGLTGVLVLACLVPWFLADEPLKRARA